MSLFTTTTRPVHLHPALTHLRLADLICRQLADHGVDCAPLAWLSRTLEVPAGQLRTTMNYAIHLGICHTRGGEVVYCLPRQPIAAGFTPTYRAGRMQLRLPAHRLRTPLLINGQRVGPAPERERATTPGAGELAYTVHRLTLMAMNWLPEVADPTRYLFELIAETWRHGRTVRHIGELGIHRASFDRSTIFGPSDPDGLTNRLELVTSRHLNGHELVNLYPIPAQGVIR